MHEELFLGMIIFGSHVAVIAVLIVFLEFFVDKTPWRRLPWKRFAVAVTAWLWLPWLFYGIWLLPWRYARGILPPVTTKLKGTVCNHQEAREVPGPEKPKETP